MLLMLVVSLCSPAVSQVGAILVAVDLVFLLLVKVALLGSHLGRTGSRRSWISIPIKASLLF